MDVAPTGLTTAAAGLAQLTGAAAPEGAFDLALGAVTSQMSAAAPIDAAKPVPAKPPALASTPTLATLHAGAAEPIVVAANTELQAPETDGVSAAPAAAEPSPSQPLPVPGLPTNVEAAATRAPARTTAPKTNAQTDIAAIPLDELPTDGAEPLPAATLARVKAIPAGRVEMPAADDAPQKASRKEEPSTPAPATVQASVPVGVQPAPQPATSVAAPQPPAGERGIEPTQRRVSGASKAEPARSAEPLVQPQLVAGSASAGVRDLPQVRASVAQSSPPPAAAPAQAAPIQQPMPVVAAHSPTFPRDMGVEVARRASSGGDELVIRLDPAELGRIHVHMAIDDRGSVRAVVSADNAAVLDALRRDSGEIARVLNEAGLRADAQSFRFDSRGGSADGGPWQGNQRSQEPRGDTAYTNLSTPSDEAEWRPMRRLGQVDLMA